VSSPGGLRVLALVLLAALSLFIVFADAAQGLRHAVFDGYQRLFVLERVSSPVTIVAIDEEDLRRYGQWPWPRTRVAELVERIAGHEPLAIGFDIFFPDADRFSPAAMAAEIPILTTELRRALEGMPSNDALLGEAIRGRDVVLGIQAEDLPDARFLQPPRASPIVHPRGMEAALHHYGGSIRSVAAIDSAAAGRGLMNSGPVDQVVRQVPLLANVQGTLVPNLGLETLRVGIGASLRVEEAPGGMLALTFGDARTTLQANGMAWLRMGRHDADRFVLAHQVLERRVDPEKIRGKAILVGINGLGVLDFKTTPLGEFVPGVEIHAQVIENIFNGVTLTRPENATRIEAAALVVCGLLLIFLVPRLSALQGINVAFGLVVLLAGAGLVAFRNFGLLLDPAWPAIGTVAVFGSVVVATLSEAERQRRQLRDQAARMAGEVDAARRIQMGLLPDPREVLGADRRFRIAAFLEPARSVGGDFYDCFMVDSEHLFFVVADVSGKGLPAALFMASVKSTIKSAALRGGRVGEILTRAQKEIAHENPEQLFVTIFAGQIDLRTGVLEYSNAGHEPPYLRKPQGSPERLASAGGPPLCVVEDFEYATDRRSLTASEWIVLVTDGITEAMNPKREFFGAERLRTSLTWMPDPVEPEEIVRRLKDDIARFADGAEVPDDITLVAVRWEGFPDGVPVERRKGDRRIDRGQAEQKTGV
jgi:serine phosphatase RsbU (regulator of sigma subunit)/CHASE2 domain-containing sensor protein